MICEECLNANALWNAAGWGHFECMKWLLEHGVQTIQALEDALENVAIGGHPECMKLLLE